jgi:putative transposase
MTLSSVCLREMRGGPVAEQVLNQVLQAQAQAALQAARHERTPVTERQGYSNGTHARALTTRVGTLTLRVPRIRDGSSSPAAIADDDRDPDGQLFWGHRA